MLKVTIVVLTGVFCENHAKDLSANYGWDFHHNSEGKERYWTAPLSASGLHTFRSDAKALGIREYKTVEVELP